MKNVILALFLLCAMVGLAYGQNPLADLANSMQPGTWAEFTGTNLTDIAFTQSNGSIVSYTDTGIWDPGTKQLMFLGSAHVGGQSGPLSTFVWYSGTTNTWRQEPLPSFMDASFLSHAYDGHAIDIAAGDFYYADFRGPLPAGQGRIYRYHIATKTWVDYLTVPYSTTIMGVTWFPELGANGSLLIFGGGGAIYRYDKATATWSSQILFPTGDYQNFAEYNPITHKVIMGGGVPSGNVAKHIYEMDSSGSVVIKADAPFDLNNPYSLMTVDPASGDFINVRRDSNLVWQFRRYDSVAQTWSSPLPNPITALNVMDGNDGMIHVPIPEYQCVLFVWHEPGGNDHNTRAFIYKGGLLGNNAPPPPPDTTAPVVSFNPLKVSGVVSLSVTATDNIGVSGVQFKSDGINIGVEVISPPYQIYWNTATSPNGAHVVSAVGRDANNNQTVATLYVSTEN